MCAAGCRPCVLLEGCRGLVSPADLTPRHIQRPRRAGSPKAPVRGPGWSRGWTPAQRPINSPRTYDLGHFARSWTRRDSLNCQTSVGDERSLVMSRPAEHVPPASRPLPGSGRASEAMTGIVGKTILGSADVSRARERHRIARLRRLVAALSLVLGWVVIRSVSGHSVLPSVHLPHWLGTMLPILVIVADARGRHGPSVHRCRALAPHADPPGRDGGRARGPGGDRRHQGRGRAFHQPLPGSPDLPRHHGRLGPAGHPLRGSARHRQDLRGQGHGQGGQRPLPLRLRLGLPVDVLRADQPQDPLLLQAVAQARPPRRRSDRFHRGDRRHRRDPARHGRRRRRRGRLRRGERVAGAAAVLRPADPGAALRLGLDRRPQPVPARRGQAAQAGRRTRQRARRRCDQPQGRSRSGAHPPRALRPHDLLRAARVVRPGPTSSPTTWARRRTRRIWTSTAPSTSWPA